MTTAAVCVHDLDLPLIDTSGMERFEALEAMKHTGAQHWLARTPLGFVISGYEDSVAVLREKRFHSALSMLREQGGSEADEYFRGRRRSILTMEGEDHTRLRRLLAPAFTPGSVEHLRPFMRQVMGSLADSVSSQGNCDVVADICEPYPIPIICELLGAPKKDWKLFSQWATDIFRLFNQDLANDLPLIARAGASLEAYVRDLVDHRREQPGDDLLSVLIATQEAGDRLSNDELVMLAEAILMAGTDTTRNQLACCMAIFSQHPEQWDLLASRPDLAARAVEESMRYLGAVRGTARVASVDIEYRGILFPRGTLVSVSLAGANRDPSKWAAADRFDISREPGTQQLTFGSGVHHCLGAALARAELQEALTVLCVRMRRIEPDGPVEWKPPTFGIWGPARLPLRVT